MKRIIISDTHIGSKYYKAVELTNFLKNVDYDELILAGDIVEMIRIPLFNKRVLEIAQAINFSKKIIYIVGNHDTPLAGLIGTNVLGVEFVKQYEFVEGGRRFRVEHGDDYDDSDIVKSSIMMSFVTAFQGWIENWFDYNLQDLYTEWSMKKKNLRRVWDIIKWNTDADVFICGHSHTPECVIWISPNQEIKTYINSGDWVSHSTYVEIIDGQARLKEYSHVI
jgi:UDP-2,3-diacylglucosamine pyrophosphatase LpxH